MSHVAHVLPIGILGVLGHFAHLSPTRALTACLLRLTHTRAACNTKDAVKPRDEFK